MSRIVSEVLGLAFGLALAFAPAATAAAAAAADKSLPQDRARFVEIARKLEGAPLDPGLVTDRAWAMQWLTEAPDVSVSVCADPLGGVIQSDYPNAPEILAQYMFSMAVRIIEQPGSANDPSAQQLAGVTGALNAYRSILRDRPDAKSPALDKLLATQSQGGLPEFVRKAWAQCQSKK